MICQYVFGDISRETIFTYYKWSDRDTFEDILQHIEWSHDKRQLCENNLSFGDDSRLQQAENKLPFSDASKNCNGRVLDHSFLSFYKISSNEYILNGRLFPLGSFGTLGSSILCSWIQGPNYSFEDTPSSEEISVIIDQQKKCSSLFLKLEIVKDYLGKELGNATFAKVYNILKGMIELSDKIPKSKVISEESLNESLGDFIFSLLVENNFLFLIVHLIINEKMISTPATHSLIKN